MDENVNKAVKSDAHKDCCGIRQYEDGTMLFLYEKSGEAVCWLNAREAAEFPLAQAHRLRAA